MLRTMVSEPTRRRCQVDEKVFRGKAWTEILRAAEVCQSDLIVMGTHGRSPLDLAFFGSTTSHVVRGALCPVLTIRAQ
jgi:nucleotide-binding universal stress UspA family protein